jgi:hypothetical protein
MSLVTVLIIFSIFFEFVEPREPFVLKVRRLRAGRRLALSFLMTTAELHYSLLFNLNPNLYEICFCSER